LALGRVDPNNGGEEFCMTVLALKLARRSNAVSSLHGLVSRRMWRPLWPARRTADVPISHITNGAHVDTWLATELGQLYGDYLGHDWRQAVTNPERWRHIERLDASHLFSIKVALKRRLLDFMMRRLEARSTRLGLSQPLPQFRADVLTVGFARRFAAYKRALILFEDPDRAKRLLTNPERPVQVIFAGKAHPADEHGKSFIRRLSEVASDPELRDHVIVLEDHDMNVSRHLLEGCDLWLNAPRRPLEACGTSGMKAVFNATLNCSTLDGWWDEAYDSTNGFAYGEGLSYADPHVQDQRDAEALMNVLETQVVPTFYDRDDTGVPARWLKMVKRALLTLAWRYNSDRMVMDYTHRLYQSASKTLTAESPSSEW
jgi:starch phosphorylase